MNDFDGDLKLDVDPRECVGITVWHKPEIFERGERDIVCTAVGPGAVFLDVGANIGVYSLLAAKRGAKVFAIEADPQNASQLRHHVELNGLENDITVFEFAALETDGEVSIYRNPINSGGSNCFDGTYATKVPASSIDSLNLPAIDICKMDIEGAEVRAILGMHETINRSPKFKLCVEFNPTLRFGNCGPLAELLHNIFSRIEIIGGKVLTRGEIPTSFCDLYCQDAFSDVDWAFLHSKFLT